MRDNKNLILNQQIGENLKTEKEKKKVEEEEEEYLFMMNFHTEEDYTALAKLLLNKRVG